MKKIVFQWQIIALVLISAATVAAQTEDFRPLDIRYHDLDLVLSPTDHLLEATDRITFDVVDKAAYSFYLGNMLHVKKAVLDGHRIKLNRFVPDAVEPDETENTPESEHPENRAIYTMPEIEPGEHVLEIIYKGIVNDTLTVREGSRSDIPEETTGLIGEEGVYLSGFKTGWYPDGREDYAAFSIRVTTPPGFESVTEGKRVSVERGEKKTICRWEVGYPTREVTLMAAKYIIREREVAGTTLMAYFFPSEEDLIDTYLDASGRYLELYNSLVGPYPFSKFAVVENFFPTGYGMPSYTLLGRRIIRMPFIVNTSLGHEVAHNWWGNGVYPDYNKGNWCEGLATYYADYRYEAQKSDSAASVYRRDINIDYAAHATDSTDVALVSFRSREDDVTGVVGYGKCMMVFHMLSQRVGEDKFYRTMRNFYRQYLFQEADWKDIESVFEETVGEPLDEYFEQWVYGKGAPRLSLENVQLEEPPADGSSYRLRVTIGNEGGFILARVPVEIYSPSAIRRINVTINDTLESFDWRLEERPIRIAVDREHHLFRKLDPAEIPVTISRALTDEAPLIVLPSFVSVEKAQAFRDLATRLANTEETRILEDTTASPADLASGTVFLLGDSTENAAFQQLIPPAGLSAHNSSFRLAGETWDAPGHAAFVAFPNALDNRRTVCAIFGNNADAVKAAGYKVIYYGKYSYVTFLDGKKQQAGVFPVTSSPLIYEFAELDSIPPESANGE